jgi:hypothetical protein
MRLFIRAFTGLAGVLLTVVGVVILCIWGTSIHKPAIRLYIYNANENRTRK